MLNIVVPMAGRGQRFVERGYELPKPLIPIHGHPMIYWVIKNIAPAEPHRFIFIILDEHDRLHGLGAKLQTWAPGSTVIPIDGVTEGAAVTVLKAASYINNDAPLMTANCDQWIEMDINDYLRAFKASTLDGFIMTMKANDTKWSYARSENGLATEVAEKKVISEDATVGIYNFKSGSAFVHAAREMIAKDIRVNGEFYVAPVYNQMIGANAKIGIFSVGSVETTMYGLGTPDDLDFFLKMQTPPRFTAFQKR